MKTKTETAVKTTVTVTTSAPDSAAINEKIAPKGMGCLDMVIAFDTTGSMAAYIHDVRKQVKEMIPRLFKDNDDLRLGIVAFGDYCDMDNATTFGDAYQCMALTQDENGLISFVNNAENTSGGDGDEFYELVLKKIIDEMPWREGATKTILLIADADPHEVGYSYYDIVRNSQIDWREEARRAAHQQIRIDTVSICGRPWYEQVAAMTNGICVPFQSSGKTAEMVETAVTAHSVMACMESRRAFGRSEMDEKERRLRDKLKFMRSSVMHDKEMSEINRRYTSEIADDDSLS